MADSPPTRSLGQDPPFPGTKTEPAHSTASSSPDAPGASSLTLVSSADRYRLGEEIAHGGMGIVHAARDTVLDRCDHQLRLV